MLAHQSPLFPTNDDELEFEPDPDYISSHWNADMDVELAMNLLALGRVKGVGIHVLRALIDQYGDLSNVWHSDHATFISTLVKVKAKDSQAIFDTIMTQGKRLILAAEKQLHGLVNNGVRVISAKSPDYPARLRDAPDHPYWLFVEGNVAALHAPLIGIVGTREPSQIGTQTAAELASIVAEQGLGIVSGLAEGIDSAAHRMGIYYGVPQVAVLGTGIDVYFPASTRRTREIMVREGGVVITEYLPGDTHYNKARFVERNRLQAALSLALCPVESRVPSGTMHTIRFAEKLKRPIFGVHYGMPSESNQVLVLLDQHEHPIFDLSMQDDVTGLISWLHSVVGTTSWPEHRYTLNRARLFYSFLRHLDDVAKFKPLTDADITWLLEEVSKRAHQGSDGSGSSDSKDT